MARGVIQLPATWLAPLHSPHAGLPLKAICEMDPPPSRPPSPPLILAWLLALGWKIWKIRWGST